MSEIVLAQGIQLKSNSFDYTIEQWLEAFLIDRKAANLSSGTLRFYRVKLSLLLRFCRGQVIGQVEQVGAPFLRSYLLWLESEGHNPGGVQAFYRAVRAFLLWWAEETGSLHKPTPRVKAPRVP